MGRTALRMRRAFLAIAVSVCGFALLAPTAGATDIYSYANGCFAIKDTLANRYVVRDSPGTRPRRQFRRRRRPST